MSPYLERPIRTEAQARLDRAGLRIIPAENGFPGWLVEQRDGRVRSAAFTYDRAVSRALRLIEESHGAAPWHDW